MARPSAGPAWPAERARGGDGVGHVDPRVAGRIPCILRRTCPVSSPAADALLTLTAAHAQPAAARTG